MDVRMLLLPVEKHQLTETVRDSGKMRETWHVHEAFLLLKLFVCG